MTPSPGEIRTIYAGIERAPGLSLDLQGWNSDGPIFQEVVNLLKPSVLIEVGCWNGASVVTTCRACRAAGLQTVVYAVDVFPGLIGGRDHIGNIPATQIPTPWSMPTRYQQFLFNIKASGFDDMVIPVATFSRWGAKILAAWGVVADAIYIDASHDFEFVTADLNDYWPLLRSGGIMTFDDLGYADVLAAIGNFGRAHGLSLSIVGGQGYFRKP